MIYVLVGVEWFMKGVLSTRDTGRKGCGVAQVLWPTLLNIFLKDYLKKEKEKMDQVECNRCTN